MAEKLEIPNFATDAEESEWWYQRRDMASEQVDAALSNDRFRRVVTDCGGITPTATIRLDPADIAKARAVAEKRGLKYQAYLQRLIREALERESAA